VTASVHASHPTRPSQGPATSARQPTSPAFDLNPMSMGMRCKVGGDRLIAQKRDRHVVGTGSGAGRG